MPSVPRAVPAPAPGDRRERLAAAAHVVGAAMLAVPEDVVRKGAESLDEAARSRAADHAGEGAGLLIAAGWACEPEAIETSRNVTSAIVDAADEHDAAIVVTGTRGRSRVAAALLGSSAEGILRRAGWPVLLVPPAQAVSCASSPSSSLLLLDDLDGRPRVATRRTLTESTHA